jgi:MinD superfamily P-loop ATPase
MVCVNKYDLNQKLTDDINAYAVNSHAEALGQIPFDTAITRAMVQAQTILEYDPSSESSQAIQDIWQKVSARVLSQ